MKIFTLPSPNSFERKLKRQLKPAASARADWGIYPNGEMHLEVRGIGRKVCVIGRTESPADTALATLLLVDTLKRNGAKDITLVLPYFGYARHDRAVKKGDSVAAAALLGIFRQVGVTRLVSVDPHGPYLDKYCRYPLVRVNMVPTMAGCMERELRGVEHTVVAPDHGAVKRAREFGELSGASAVAWVDKKRMRRGGVVAQGLRGSIAGRTAVIVDDQVDTGGTVIEAVKLLRKNGFREFHLCATHPVLSKGAKGKLERINFRTIMFSDTVVGTGRGDMPARTIVVSAAELLAKAVG
ncbi:MAG: ribose-phosphate diphosphokinase [Patescibacteria group bacterium]|nr:ribose-phosphate diphosphokinase [Patescibacteria group bacterium]